MEQRISLAAMDMGTRYKNLEKLDPLLRRHYPMSILLVAAVSREVLGVERHFDCDELVLAARVVKNESKKIPSGNWNSKWLDSEKNERL